MKTCFKCGRWLPLEEFYEHPRMADGHFNKCKECSRADAKSHRKANHASVCAYDRMRNATPQRKAQNRATKRNDPRRRAWQKLEKAIRSGLVKPEPCGVCGHQPAEAHHDDYSKPLDVRWLCFRHHREIAHGQKVEIEGNDWRTAVRS